MAKMGAWAGFGAAAVATITAIAAVLPLRESFPRWLWASLLLVAVLSALVWLFELRREGSGDSEPEPVMLAQVVGTAFMKGRITNSTVVGNVSSADDFVVGDAEASRIEKNTHLRDGTRDA